MSVTKGWKICQRMRKEFIQRLSNRITGELVTLFATFTDRQRKALKMIIGGLIAIGTAITLLL